jgi:hypothetical protein
LDRAGSCAAWATTLQALWHAGVITKPRVREVMASTVSTIASRAT